ncbi:hypothetical protein [Bradyrhizobium sp. JYMT SZCCT0180]|uniref:hypothetical protein n=1 Tax=Bradyrhizobium sp. JYMT SZCCT0180 TaxID=2807666 RepID=UPI001BA6EA3D|nr:hypothetical protein [Bradyrhizobium sp. JYMT SZCCT0180]MBR1211171.1 hypothetical protein [Bradyrhizobium sp. JYMT SZCCT0180]
MSRELWATYSVRDHLTPRNLAVDVVLFDRLVFPVPAVGYFPDNSGPPNKNGPVDWKPDLAEWARWEKGGWDPAAQHKLLDLLSPVIRRVSWNSEGKMEDEYRAEAARLAAQGVPDYAFAATRTLLTRDLPAYVDGVALGPAYRSFKEFESEGGNHTPGGRQVLPRQLLANVLAAELLVPDVDDDKLSDEKMLTEVVEFVTGDAEFRKRRTAFIDWQQNFIRDGTTDRESIDRAVKEMRELVDSTNTAAKKLTIRKVARNLFRLAPSALGVAGAALGGGLEFAAGGVFLSVGAIAVDEKVFKSAEQLQSPAAAFVHDARRRFGWK